MHFKASCSYAALANLLEMQGYDTEDTIIALEMELPKLFSKEAGAFLSGPMLQGAKWFNLWLLPRGFTMMETSLSKSSLCQELISGRPAMLGIRTPYGKHAVVFTGYDGEFHFLNPTYKDSGEKTELLLDEEELLASVDSRVAVGRVQPTLSHSVDLTPIKEMSALILQENVDAIVRFAELEHPPEEYLTVLNTLFRPLLLDGITMMELAGKQDLADKLRSLQGNLMAFLRGDRSGKLCDTLSLPDLQLTAKDYIASVEHYIDDPLRYGRILRKAQALIVERQAVLQREYDAA